MTKTTEPDEEFALLFDEGEVVVQLPLQPEIAGPPAADSDLIMRWAPELLLPQTPPAPPNRCPSGGAHVSAYGDFILKVEARPKPLYVMLCANCGLVFWTVGP